MSDAVQGAVGKALRAARESRGMSVEDAATRLRLMHRQIDAMESEDFSSLGQPVFARGFVRNYARLLGLDPEPLLAGMAGAPEDAAPVAHVAAPAPAHWLTSPWILMLMLGTLLAVALPIALYWWLNSDAGEEVHVTSNVLPVPAEPRPVAAPTHAPLPAAQPPAATATAPFVAETALKTPAAA
ncbi:MAG: helix-turn-helix domain-containing protein, partial [Thiobacillus sp.]|nr:helix-turn-helix domain-containing protein [Thiobacillus sp.]